MHYMALDKSKQAEIENLFSSVFTVSEGEEEGRSIGRLASALSKNIDGQEIICFGAYDGESLIGAIFFTLLEYNIPAQIFLLSPTVLKDILSLFISCSQISASGRKQTFSIIYLTLIF